MDKAQKKEDKLKLQIDLMAKMSNELGSYSFLYGKSKNEKIAIIEKYRTALSSM